MARTYAQFSTAIWRDADFLALPGPLQRVYFLLSSQPDITAAGVLPLAVNRWARKAPDTTPRDIVEALNGLVDRRFIVYDRDTEEVFVRSFVRWDNGYKNPKRLHAIRDAADGIESPTLVSALAAEFERLEVPTAFRGQCTISRTPASRKPVHDDEDDEYPQVDGQSMALPENEEGESIRRRRVPQPSTRNPQPVPPPADGAAVAAEQSEFPGMPKAEVVLRVETDEQVAYRLARRWKKLREDRNQPIVPRGKSTEDVVFPLQKLFKGALLAKYTEDEINEALERCKDGIPTATKLDGKLADIREEAARASGDINDQGRASSDLSRRGTPLAKRSTSALRAEQALSVADALDRKFGHGKYATEGTQ